MQRKGHAVTLEPLTETGRRCEFAAESVPPTSWEVKSVLDQQPVRERERVSIGELSLVVAGRRELYVRGREAIFRPGRNTRISAVMHYTRRRPGDVSKKVYHNPFAEVELPLDLLREGNLRQVRRVEHDRAPFTWRKSRSGEVSRRGIGRPSAGMAEITRNPFLDAAKRAGIGASPTALPGSWSLRGNPC